MCCDKLGLTPYQHAQANLRGDVVVYLRSKEAVPSIGGTPALQLQALYPYFKTYKQVCWDIHFMVSVGNHINSQPDTA